MLDLAIAMKSQDLPSWLQVVAAYIPLGVGGIVGFLRLYKRNALMAHRLTSVETAFVSLHSDLNTIEGDLSDMKRDLGSIEGKIDTLIGFAQH